MGLAMRPIKIIGESINKKVDDDDYFNNRIDTSWNVDFNFQLGSLKEKTVYDYEDIDENSFSLSYSEYNSFRKCLHSLNTNESLDELYDNREYDKLLYEKWYDVDRKNKLEKIIDDDDGKDKLTIPPFFELLYFSDCEGMIGPNVCNKILKDFHENYENAKNSKNLYFFEHYKELYELLKVVVQSGGSLLFY